VSDNSVVVSDGPKKYEMNIDYIQKYYEVGEEVSYDGVNGIIVKLNNETLVGNNSIPINTTAILAIRGCGEEVVADIDRLQKPILETKTFSEPVKPRRIKMDPLVNKAVRIKKGEFKGQEGIIRDIYKGKCRVLLNTNKYVGINLMDLTVERPRSYIPLSNKVESYNGHSIITPGYKTPGYKTPGYKTPFHMSAFGENATTPEYDSGMTPVYHTGMTPGYHTGMTPGYNDKIDKYEEAGTDWLNKLTSAYNGTVIKIKDREYIVDDYIDGIFKCKGGEIFEKRDVKYIQPEKYEDAIILEGVGKGETGALVSIKSNFGSIRVKSGEIYEVRLEDISIKRRFEERL